MSISPAEKTFEGDAALFACLRGVDCIGRVETESFFGLGRAGAGLEGVALQKESSRPESKTFRKAASSSAECFTAAMGVMRSNNALARATRPSHAANNHESNSSHQ